ncbi:MAG: DUF362 domain-containing protein [Bacteroidales bacterium]|nr:DUF362 domain-containing protein [Bacteroidales bacterium]
MSNKMNRRKFVKQTGALSTIIAGSSVIPGLSSCSLFTTPADIGVVEGKNYFENTILAIDLIGGMKKFVPEGSKVGLLINSDFDVPGAYVNQDIPIAALKMIEECSASEITCLQVVKEEYWERSKHYEKYKSLIGSLLQVEQNIFPAEFNDRDFVKVENIAGAISLKETEVVKKWLECDVFINIPISKHHATTLLTGALKNIMGVSTRKANVTFHLGSGKRNDPEYLAQCIADQHLLRKTDLCIIDATEFIIDNGPSGPGTLVKHNKIIAGTDVVALDALSGTYLGYSPDEILTTQKAHDIGLGNMDYSKLNIVHETV